MFSHRSIILATVGMSLILSTGSNAVRGLSIPQTTYNFTDSTEFQTNNVATPIPQAGLDNVPPDVLKAIYPNGTPSSTFDREKSYFDQPSSPSVNQLKPIQAPTRFNDALVPNDEPRISVQDAPAQRTQTQPVSSALRPASNQSELRELLEQPLTAKRVGQSSQNREPQFDSDLIPANHVVPEKFDRRIESDIPLLKQPVGSLTEPLPAREKDSRKSFMAASETVSTGIENGNKLPSTNPSLSEILAESNRNIRAKNENLLTRAKSESQESGLLSAYSGNGIELGRKIREISVGLCIVLGIGVGFILIARLWFRNQNRSPQKNGLNRNESAQSTSKIHLTTSLRLDSKSTLHLVEAANQRVLVATDLNGIKSVVALTPTFETELSSMLETENPKPSAVERNDDFDEIYSPVPKHHQLGKKLETRDLYPLEKDDARTNDSRNNQPTKSSLELETEMRRQLAELLGGKAFRDVFMQPSGNGRR